MLLRVLILETPSKNVKTSPNAKFHVLINYIFHTKRPGRNDISILERSIHRNTVYKPSDQSHLRIQRVFVTPLWLKL